MVVAAALSVVPFSFNIAPEPTESEVALKVWPFKSRVLPDPDTSTGPETVKFASSVMVPVYPELRDNEPAAADDVSTVQG